MDGIKALTFDTGGTVLDWHSGLSRALGEAGERRGIKADWGEVANEYRRRSLGTIVNQIGPRFNFDDVHRDQLDRVLDDRGLAALDAADRERIWRTWHELDAWPDFPPALRRLRRKYPCVSFTLLTPALVIAVSRKNGIDWDCIISCEMLGVYKVRPEAYRATAKLLQLAPAEILMVACHNFDLDAARKEGFNTCFVKRPDEWGPAGPPDPVPNPGCTMVVDTFGELAERLGC
ncbi:MAG TPA: haloacid dehalogenase type II [Hyphomicrobiaceae bacterium]|nr:haloacid dehalogenase type II [Hyphomicrobiaceae bacterium]